MLLHAYHAVPATAAGADAAAAAAKRPSRPDPKFILSRRINFVLTENTSAR